MALVPDALLNPHRSHVETALDVLGCIDAHDYGVMQLPPPGKHALLLAVIADQIAEYLHHGYAVVAIGMLGEVGALHWRRLAPLLRRRGAAPPPRHFIRPLADVAFEEQRLSAFLFNYDLPEDERRRWRV